MNKKARWLVSVLYVAVYFAALFYLQRSGLWAHSRWTGLAFGTAWAVHYIFFTREHLDQVFDLRIAISFCLAGLIFLLTFLIEPGDSGDGFLAAMFLGFGAQSLYANYRARGLKIENRTSNS